ncbi:MAG: hypothetical protein QM762_15525 [Chryseolinea sp.]
MKKVSLIIVLALITSTAGMSQQTSLNEEYWVVETHTHDSVYSVVRFFDGNNALMHEFRIDNIALDIHQKKQRKRLDQLLSDFKTRTARSAKKIRSRTSI